MALVPGEASTAEVCLAQVAERATHFSSLPLVPGKINERAVSQRQAKQLYFCKGALEVSLINETLILSCSRALFQTGITEERFLPGKKGGKRVEIPQDSGQRERL